MYREGGGLDKDLATCGEAMPETSILAPETPTQLRFHDGLGPEGIRSPTGRPDGHSKAGAHVNTWTATGPQRRFWGV